MLRADGRQSQDKPPASKSTRLKTDYGVEQKPLIFLATKLRKRVSRLWVRLVLLRTIFSPY